ncbi:MAG: hypothetical protein ACUVUR_01475 [bacterium]
MKRVWFLSLLIVAAGAKIEPREKVKQVGLSVIRRVTVDYYLLSRNRPVEFNVTQIPDSGLWLRVYTRLYFSNDATEKGHYSLFFQKRDSIRKFRFETKVSPSTLGPQGQRVGEWRSFYVRLLPGENSFSLKLDSALSETVAVRFNLQPPRPWETVIVPGVKELTLIIKEQDRAVRKGKYYRLNTGESFSFSTSGPGRLRLRLRIDFYPGIQGRQSFVVQVEENGCVRLERTLRVSKDLSAQYQEVGDVIPSVERRIDFAIGDGEHNLTIKITGTITKTAVLAIDRLVNERYE